MLRNGIGKRGWVAPVLGWVAPILVLTAGARADELRTDLRAEATSRQHQLRFDGGFASALGLGGLAYTYAATPSALIEVGAGLGFSGLQLSVMPKLSVGSERNRFVAGAGVSVGLPVGLFRLGPFGETAAFLNI